MKKIIIGIVAIVLIIVGISYFSKNQSANFRADKR